MSGPSIVQVDRLVFAPTDRLGKSSNSSNHRSTIFRLSPCFLGSDVSISSTIQSFIRSEENRREDISTETHPSPLFQRLQVIRLSRPVDPIYETINENGASSHRRWEVLY